MAYTKPQYSWAERIYDDLRFASRSYRRKLALLDPERAVRLCYQHTCKAKLDLQHPETLPEVIQWLKLYSDTDRWAELADKIGVRHYVENCGFAHHLNTLYTTFERAEEIPWAQLPAAFVLKLNNGCHSVLPIAHQAEVNRAQVVRQFQQWMRHPYGLASAEFHYQHIRPLIMAERYLVQEPGLVDYKIYCIGGHAEAILHCQARHRGKAIKTLLNRHWEVVPTYNTRPIAPAEAPQAPTKLNEIVEAAERLAQPFPFVRIDYYEIEQQPIFGEMTFTPAGGYRPYGSPLFYQVMGRKIMNLFDHEED